MSKTPKTDALRLKMAQLGWPPDAEPVAMIMSSHDQIESDLDLIQQTGLQIWKANERLKSELVAERALADRLAGALSVYWGDCRHLGYYMPEPANRKAEDAVAAWKEARRGA